MPESHAAKSLKEKDTAQRRERHSEIVGQFAPIGPRASVLALQRSAGNQASNHLLGRGFKTSPSIDGLLRRKCACGNQTRAGGKREECDKKQRLGLQAKLTVNEPGDIYEQEADRIADQVMAAPAHTAVSPTQLRIQRFAGQSNGQMGAAPASVDHALASPGRPLEPALRQDMEVRFGHDFSRVRAHTGAAAEQSARDMNANAYTTGHDIVFGSGRFAAGTRQGRRLIAHELAHVIQQSGQMAPAAQRSQGMVQRQPADSSPQTPGAPYRLELSRGLDIANPFSDVEAHASMYELAPALVGRLSATYNLDEKVAWRLFEWAAAGITFMTQMTYSHEQGGHAGVGRRFGWDPSVTLKAPWSGVTSRGVPSGVTVTPDQDISFITGGVNQERINASRMASRWALRGDISYQEAMAYLYAQTNMAAYALRTLALSIKAPEDDINSYVTKQGSLSVGELFALAAATDLLSGPAWAALIGQFNYILHGERRVEIPTFKVGREMRATIPNWRLLLSSRGPLLGGRSTINVGGRIPVEVSIDRSLDEPGIAVGAQAHWAPMPSLRLSAFGRASFSESEGVGGLGGVEAQYNITPLVGISARLSYRKKDLLTQPEGAAEGLEGRAALTFDF